MVYQTRARQCKPECSTGLRTDPGPVGVGTVFSELDKLAVLNSLNLPDALFTSVGQRSLRRWQTDSKSHA